MRETNPTETPTTAIRHRYSAMAMLLHWLVAGFLIANLALGWRMERLAGFAQFEAFQLHKSIGMTVLVLSLLRVLWRLGHRPPALPATMSAAERLAARVTHLAFYGLTVGLPITGWVLVSVSPLNIPTLLWHVVPLPHIGMAHDLPGPARLAAGAVATRGHLAMALGGTALIALHVLAALKHQFVDRDGVLGRMMPFLAADAR